MTTLIAVYTSDGCVGRCHDAVSPACDCICGGRLHGVGSRGELRRRVDEEARDALRRRTVQERAQLLRLGDEFRRLGLAGFRERGGR